MKNVKSSKTITFADLAPAHSEQWQARRDMAEAVRGFLEVFLTSNPPIEELQKVTTDLNNFSQRFEESQRLYGRMGWIAESDYGSFRDIFHEINLSSGGSNPIGPVVQAWVKGNELHGSVNVGWAYEGPPNSVHGGMVAAIFDHFLGMAQIFGENPGMTAYLHVNYHKPTPIKKELQLMARVVESEGRKTKVYGEMRCDEIVTASCEALFVAPKDFTTLMRND